MFNNYLGWFIIVDSAGIFAILGIVLHQHKVFVRMKDRLNVLWRKHLTDAGRPEEYVPLEPEK